jgi:HSP20 family protein
MTRIIRWNPSRETRAMLEAVDRVFDGTRIDPNSYWMRSQDWGVPLDIVESEDEFVLKASIPGVNPQDIEITRDGEMLTIRGEINAEKEDEGKHFHLRERRHGSFCRSVYLPTDIKNDDIDAEYKEGILTVRLPKTEEAKPKKVVVKSIDSKKKLESGK